MTTEHRACGHRHRTGCILHPNGIHFAACGCGWIGPSRTVRDLAQADANAHELAMLVGEDGQPDDRLTTAAF